MKGWFAAWQAMRILRWIFMLWTVAYGIYFLWNRAPHLTQFGNLNHTTEFFLFGLPIAVVAAGFFELMFRARASDRPEV